MLCAYLMCLYRRKGTFFVSQVVLTPKASTVMKGVASGLRETITERCVCVWQKHCEAFKFILTSHTQRDILEPNPAACWFPGASCRRLTRREIAHLVQVSLFFVNSCHENRGRTLFLVLVSNLPLASPLHLNVTSFKKPQQRKPSVYFWNELFT